MPTSVRVRAHRTLRHLAAFELLRSDGVANLAHTPASSLLPGEEVIGLYRNGSPENSEDILVTSEGLRLGMPRTGELVPYAGLAEVVLPHAEDKEVVDALRLRLTDGQVRELPVRGGTAQFRDAWEFLRFLQRVIADTQAERRS